MAQEVKNLPAVQEMQETRVQSLRRKDPLEKEMATHSNILALEIPQRSLAGSSPWGCKRVWLDWAHTCDERYERFRVPLLSCKPVLVQMLSGPFPVILWELWDSGNQLQECADTLVSSIGLSSKFFCVLLRSITVYTIIHESMAGLQVNLQGIISEASQSLSVSTIIHK